MLCSGGARTQPNELQDSSSAFSADLLNDAFTPPVHTSSVRHEAEQGNEATHRRNRWTETPGGWMEGWRDGGMQPKPSLIGRVSGLGMTAEWWKRNK